MKEIHPVVVVVVAIAALLLGTVVIARTFGVPVCTEWTNVTMPEEKTQQAFIVQDDDGTHHQIIVPGYRPAHSHRICTSYQPTVQR